MRASLSAAVILLLVSAGTLAGCGSSTDHVQQAGTDPLHTPPQASASAVSGRAAGTAEDASAGAGRAASAVGPAGAALAGSAAQHTIPAETPSDLVLSPDNLAREQWQTHVDSDTRLLQPVQIEIAGESVVSALECLSEEVGVLLSVAPEDLATVGERKLTIIAQGLSLKGIMVQLPTALQECHWDIQTKGPQPAYLLHRNGSAESAMVEAMEDAVLGVEEEARPRRTARVEAARQALAMSPQELAELAETDPLLAAAVKDPYWRSNMEIFFSLPQEMMDEFLSTGEVGMALATAPDELQTAVSEYLRSQLGDEEDGSRQNQSTTHYTTLMVENMDQVKLCYTDYAFARGLGGIGLRISANVMQGGGEFSLGSRTIPQRVIFNPPWVPDDRVTRKYRDRLIESGYDVETADAVIARLVAQFDEEAIARRDRKREMEWREPRNAELKRKVTLPFQGPTEPEEMHRFIAKQTGLSVVSDYFAAWGPQRIPEEAKTAQPIWWLLYVLGESWFPEYHPDYPGGYVWEDAGNCLVFHDRSWYRRAPQEYAGSLFVAYREKLERQGQFTLDDAAAFLVELDRRRPTHPELQRLFPRAPEDLRAAGLGNLNWPTVRIYAALSPAQREKARSAAGLPYREMTAGQKELVLQSSTSRRDKHPLPDGDIHRAVYRVTRSGDTYTLRVEFPSRTVETTVKLRPAAS